MLNTPKLLLLLENLKTKAAAAYSKKAPPQKLNSFHLGIPRLDPVRLRRWKRNG